MPEVSRHGWRVGALALAFAGAAVPTVAATPESVTIPLKVVTIPGVTRVSQAQESAGAMNFKLSAEEIARLDEISRKMQ